jgi:hypothetical protein
MIQSCRIVGKERCKARKEKEKTLKLKPRRPAVPG